MDADNVQLQGLWKNGQKFHKMCWKNGQKIRMYIGKTDRIAPESFKSTFHTKKLEW